MGLKDYQEKRDFNATSEPEGKVIRNQRGALRFVVQKHVASHLHYDFRLEVDGVLKSWAIPKGPSLNPVDKRLAIQVEDHPFDYRTFEGVIPEGNYGAGIVMVWDKGTYYASQSKSRQETEKLMQEGLANGRLQFILEGKKLKGEFYLIRIKGQDKQWLFMKKNDQQASTDDITLQDRSVISQRSMKEIGGLENQ
jgi:bifunctional non-homologous end joining protein LigD